MKQFVAMLAALLTTSAFGAFPEESGLVRTDAGLLFVDDEDGSSLLLQTGERVPIVNSAGEPAKPKADDFEGITQDPADPSIVCVTGSHEPKENLDRRTKREVVLKLKLEKTADGYRLRELGRYTGLIDDVKSIFDGEQAPRLVGSDPERLAVRFNVEGLAARGDSLFLGIRAPLSEKGDAMVLEVPAASLFESSPSPHFTLHEVDLGGLGIRGMEWDSVADEMLLVAGPAGDGGGGFALRAWKPAGEARVVYTFSETELRNPEKDVALQPEGVIRSGADAYLVCKDAGGKQRGSLQLIPAAPAQGLNGS